MHEAIRRAAGLAAAMVLLAPATARADNWGAPQPIPNNVLFAQSNADAEAEAGEPLTDQGDGICGTAPDPQTETEGTLWYSFRGTGGPMSFTTSGSDFDTQIAVYEGPAPAPLDNGLFCDNDRIPGTDADSQIDLSSTDAGKEYLLQIGGCDDDLNPGACPFGGPRRGTALFGVITNDSRSFPETIAPGPRLSRTNAGASTEAGELTSCSGATFGKSVWFRYNATAAGRASIEVTSFDTVIGIYRVGSSARLTCNDNTGDANTAELNLNVTPGAYLVQVGGKGADEAAQFGNFGYRVSFTPNTTPPPPPPPPPPPDPDSDRDGLVDSQDCADNDPQRRQGFKEILGNSRDEDCDGTAQDFPEVRARRGTAVYSAAARTRLSTLFVNRLSAGDKVTITCKGRGCGRKRYVKRFRKARAKYNFAKAMRRNRPGRGAVLEVRVTHPQRIGHVWRYKFRFYKNPTLQEDLCLRPGAKTPKRCP